jgi:hypothetical protein
MLGAGNWQLTGNASRVLKIAQKLTNNGSKSSRF